MTRIYFVRHAEPDKTVEDERTRPLSKKGLSDTQFVYDTLKDKGIDVAVCSPYKRSVDTIKRLTELHLVQSLIIYLPSTAMTTLSE